MFKGIPKFFNVLITISSAVTEKPHDASYHLNILLSHSW